MNRIESSAEGLVDRDLLELIQADNPIVVSGQPLRVFHPTDSEQDRFLQDCYPLSEEQLLPPFGLFKQVIPKNQRLFIAPEFNTDQPYDVGDGEASYPAIQGFLLDGSEVVLGIREALGFYAKSLQD